jgi:glycosyltransferase involved in cell wall biosynthesis
MDVNLTENGGGKVLSVIIPSYNEEKTIAAVLQKLVAVELPHGLSKEIIVVDDGSTDNTESEVMRIAQALPGENIQYIRQSANQGKGMAIRRGIGAVSGDYVVIQDADLEYDPNDFCLMLPYLLSGEYEVVYGSRFLNRRNRHSYQSFYWGGRLISLVTNLLYRQSLTDEPTCYKMFTSSLLKSIPLSCTGFEFCPEVTAKVSKRGHWILEVPIHYYPRSVEEGKKIKWTDGVEALLVLLKYRFSN